MALIVAHPAGHEELRDTCVVTVKTDKPVIDAGSARRVGLGVSVGFPLKVRQEYGEVLSLKWDLDGDGNWEDSVLNSDTAQPAFTYNTARTYKARFRARDSGKNIDSATKTTSKTAGDFLFSTPDSRTAGIACGCRKVMTRVIGLNSSSSPSSSIARPRKS